MNFATMAIADGDGALWAHNEDIHTKLPRSGKLIFRDIEPKMAGVRFVARPCMRRSVVPYFGQSDTHARYVSGGRTTQ